MNTTRIKAPRGFKYPQVDTIVSALMLAVGLSGVCAFVVSAASSVLGA